MSQLVITTIFGLVGLLFFLTNFAVDIPPFNFKKLMLLIGFISALFLITQKLGVLKNIQNYWNKIRVYLNKIQPRNYFKILGLALLRYLVFSHQFYLLLWMFEVKTPYLIIMNLLFCVYFLASIIPSLAIFDWVIKGSIAIFIFGFIGLNELTIVTVTTLMWVLNFGFPALLGSIFVLNFKLKETT